MGTTEPPAQTPPAWPGDPTFLRWLAEGPLTLEGQIRWSSNATFLCRLGPPAGEQAAEGEPRRAVYKPRRGERPLWDFPSGTLCLRERAAWLLSEDLGWHLVPPTVLRDGPIEDGWGMAQAFIPHDPGLHYLAGQGWDRRAVRRLAVFDALINNADRKSGHVLADANGRLWAIDHGIAFHAEDKLRTVLWDWAGQALPSGARADLRALQVRLADPGSAITRALGDLLSGEEMAALARRCRDLAEGGRYPEPDPERYSMPWPPV